MKRLVIAPLIIIISLPSITLSQPIQIPVIPYSNKPAKVSYKVHNLCKGVKNYWECVKRPSGKVITSLDMDY